MTARYPHGSGSGRPRQTQVRPSPTGRSLPPQERQAHPAQRTLHPGPTPAAIAVHGPWTRSTVFWLSFHMSCPPASHARSRQTMGPLPAMTGRRTATTTMTTPARTAERRCPPRPATANSPFPPGCGAARMFSILMLWLVLALLPHGQWFAPAVRPRCGDHVHHPPQPDLIRRYPALAPEDQQCFSGEPGDPRGRCQCGGGGVATPPSGPWDPYTTAPTEASPLKSQVTKGSGARRGTSRLTFASPIGGERLTREPPPTAFPQVRSILLVGRVGLEPTADGL